MTLMATDDRSEPVQQIIDRAQALAAGGAILEAIETLDGANRAQADDTLERQLVALRASAFSSLPAARPREAWPPTYPDPFPNVAGLPHITADALTPEILGGAILHHGSLWVRGLVSRDEAARLQAGIDRAFQARDAFHAGTPVGETSPWYAHAPMDPGLAAIRPWVEDGGGVWTADSPRMLSELVALFDQRGIIDTIAGILGERPALSIGKSTLRRVPPTTKTDWHQDGAFLGESVRTVNCWLSLSDCGRDAPGLDVLARRLSYIVKTGTHGAHFDWSVGHGMVETLEVEEAGIVSPEFAAGDALLFDQLMLHRTGVRPGMTRSRWAVESWFFAPSSFPMEQAPLVV